MTSLLKNINNGARKFTGFKNNVSIKFPFVTVFYLFLYITFNLINKKKAYSEYSTDEAWVEWTLNDKRIIAGSEDDIYTPKVKLYATLKKANMLYFYPYIRAIGDGHFYHYGFKKTGEFILFILVISCISLINEFLVGHKLLLLFMLVAMFNLYFSELQYSSYVSDTAINPKTTFMQPTRTAPYCCGSSIYTFFMGSGIIALFSKMTNYNSNKIL